MNSVSYWNLGSELKETLRRDINHADMNTAWFNAEPFVDFGGGGGGWIYELINETHFFHVSLRPESRSRKALEKQYLFRGSLCFQNKTTSQKWIHQGGGAGVSGALRSLRILCIWRIGSDLMK